MVEDDAPADICRAMADRCERIDPNEFAGLILIVPPPDESGQVGAIELLLVDPRQDLANFWSTVKSKAAIAADEWVASQNVSYR